MKLEEIKSPKDVKKLNIKVDGVKEDRRGRKIYPGSVVEVEKSQYEVC